MKLAPRGASSPSGLAGPEPPRATGRAGGARRASLHRGHIPQLYGWAAGPVYRIKIVGIDILYYLTIYSVTGGWVGMRFVVLWPRARPSDGISLSPGPLWAEHSLHAGVPGPGSVG